MCTNWSFWLSVFWLNWQILFFPSFTDKTHKFLVVFRPIDLKASIGKTIENTTSWEHLNFADSYIHCLLANFCLSEICHRYFAIGTLFLTKHHWLRGAQKSNSFEIVRATYLVEQRRRKTVRQRNMQILSIWQLCPTPQLDHLNGREQF